MPADSVVVPMHDGKNTLPFTVPSSSACLLPLASVLTSTGSDRAGLTSATARERRILVGQNELKRGDKEGVLAKFVEKIKEPMIASLLISAIVSCFTGQYDDAVSITLAVVIVITVACVQEYKSDQSLAALNKLAPPGCHVHRDGRQIDSLALDLVPGDIISIVSGDRVPADIRLLEAIGLSVDESSLTGETEPSEKDTAALPPPSGNSVVPVAERKNCCFMGSLVNAGRGVGVVIATGMNTELGAVCAMMDDADDKKSPLQEKMDALGKQLSMLSFAIIGVIVLIGLIGHKALLEMFTIGVSLAVAAIPEGLPIVVTVTLALGVQRMALKNAVVKKLPAVEALGCTNVLCVDKTGTLTRNEMTCVEAFTLVRSADKKAEATVTPSQNAIAAAASDSTQAHHLLHDALGSGIGSRAVFTGLGYDASNGAAFHASHKRRKDLTTPMSAAVDALKDVHMSLLMEAGVVCNNASLYVDENSKTTVVGQPTEAALLTAAGKIRAKSSGKNAESSLGAARHWYTRTAEIPFSSESKWMAVRARNIPGAGRIVEASTNNTAPMATAMPEALQQQVSMADPVPGEYVFVKGSVDAVLSLCDFTINTLAASEGGNDALAHTVLGEPLRAFLMEHGVNPGSIDFTVAPLSVLSQASILAAAETMAREGLRVLALAKGDCIPRHARYGGPSRPRQGEAADHGSSSSAASLKGLVFLGLVGLHDPPREGVIDTIGQLRRGGVRVCMITGDSQATALAIAAHLGLVEEETNAAASHRFRANSQEALAAGFGMLSPSTDMGAAHEVDVDKLVAQGVALSGAEVDTLSEVELADKLERSNVTVFFRTTPSHKMKIVHAFQRSGFVVAMTGDGVNDAPALKVADIGVAMGRSGTDVAKEAAHMVLMDDNMPTIMSAIEEGKGIFYNIRNFVRFQLSTSVAALSLLALSTLFGLPNPLNAMQILWINIIMDGPPAQSLGVEPVDHDVMRRPPRPRNEPVITRALLVRILTSAIIIVAGTMWVFWTEMHAEGGEFSVTRRDTTMTFTTFVMFDMFNALTSRSLEKSIFSLGFSSNKFFLYAVGGSLAGQVAVIYVPFLQAVFQTEAISVSDWMFITLLASSVLWVDEARKWVLRRQADAASLYSSSSSSSSAVSSSSSSSSLLSSSSWSYWPQQLLRSVLGHAGSHQVSASYRRLNGTRHEHKREDHDDSAMNKV